MVSRKQILILKFIADYAKQHGVAPSLQEIADKFDFLGHASSAQYHVKRLQAEGYLDRKSNKARSIGIFPDKSVRSPFLAQEKLDSISVPVVGAANAGLPSLLAEEHIDAYLKVSRSQLKKQQGVFALRVQGDSMNQAKIEGKNIEEGDFVLIDSEYRSPRSGDYVLSIIDGCANLKRFHIDQPTKSVMLVSESSNPKHKPIYISSEDDFMINGKIINVIKK